MVVVIVAGNAARSGCTIVDPAWGLQDGLGYVLLPSSLEGSYCRWLYTRNRVLREEGYQQMAIYP